MTHKSGSWRDVMALAKPRLSALVIFTTGSGILLAPGTIGPWRALWTLVGATLLVASANAFNCYWERHRDGLMHRTRHRPLPSGRLQPATALWAGGVWGVVGLPLLWFFANPSTAGLGLAAFLIYVFVYTPMKTVSSLALVVGAIPGALPPLMGWTAVTNGFELEGLILFGILFLWQMPHFLAISCYLKEDYGRAGHRVFSIVYGDGATKIIASLTVIVVVLISYLPAILGWTDLAYSVSAALLGLLFLGWSLKGVEPNASKSWARRLFLASLGYLTLLFVVLIARAEHL